MTFKEYLMEDSRMRAQNERGLHGAAQMVSDGMTNQMGLDVDAIPAMNWLKGTAGITVFGFMQGGVIRKRPVILTPEMTKEQAKEINDVEERCVQIQIPYALEALKASYSSLDSLEKAFAREWDREHPLHVYDDMEKELVGFIVEHRGKRVCHYIRYIDYYGGKFNRTTFEYEGGECVGTKTRLITKHEPEDEL